VNVVHVLDPLVDGLFGGSNIVQSSGILNLRFLEKRLRTMNILAVPTDFCYCLRRLNKWRWRCSHIYSHSANERKGASHAQCSLPLLVSVLTRLCLRRASTSSRKWNTCSSWMKMES
jgi:hypothetical protein